MIFQQCLLNILNLKDTSEFDSLNYYFLDKLTSKNKKEFVKIKRFI
jgi:DNA repair protein RecN (Recombination protein N)